MKALKQLVRFGWEQAQSCLFPVVIFASLALTQIMPLPFLPRYDWLLIICLSDAMVDGSFRARNKG